MGALRIVAALLLLVLAGCGGGDSSPQLVDGSPSAQLPAELEGLEGGVLTHTDVKSEGDLDQVEYRACGVPDGGDRTVIERTGLHASSLTIEAGSSLYGCDQIPEPLTAQDSDLPLGGVWCANTNGRVENGALTDPRLDLCPDSDNDLTAFVWVEPRTNTRWVVVRDAGRREVYEVAAALPVRVTTTENIDPAGSASFDIEEYGADGRRLRAYTLDAQVAG